MKHNHTYTQHNACLGAQYIPEKITSAHSQAKYTLSIYTLQSLTKVLSLIQVVGTTNNKT